MTKPFTLSTLKECPQFCKNVSDSLWGEWWHKRGVEQSVLDGLIQQNLLGLPLPVCFVAHKENDFIGTVSLIASDMDIRPALSPWLAALWVKPDCRGQGIARALVMHVANYAFTAGFLQLYLCATEKNAGYYRGLGWTVHEENIGAEGMTVFIQHCPAIRPATVHDAQAICDLLKLSIKTLCVEDHKNDPAILARWADSKTPEIITAWMDDPNTNMFVAEQDGRVVSVGSVSRSGEILLNYIHPSARFQGISRRMVHTLEQSALTQGAATLTLSSTGTARRFYLSLGYVEEKAQPGLFGTIIYLMHKNVGDVAV